MSKQTETRKPTARTNGNGRGAGALADTNSSGAVKCGRAVYFTLVKIQGANGPREAARAHKNFAQARDYADKIAENYARHGLRAEVRIYDASLVACVRHINLTDAKGGAL